MLLTKLKGMTAVLVVLTGFTVGAGLLGHALATEQGNGTAPAKVSSSKVRPAFDDAQVVPPKIQDVQRSDASWNLRQIGIAFQQYSDQMKSLPAHAIYSKDDKAPLLSWRVAILPYLGQNALYQEFKLDEPWDSPHNKQLIAKMPSIYEPAGSGQREEGLTSWQVFNGPDAVFDGNKKMAFGDIKDGLANTILVIEGKNPVIWTKPADLTLAYKVIIGYRQLSAAYETIIQRRAQREAAALQVVARFKEYAAGEVTDDFLHTSQQQWAAAVGQEYLAAFRFREEITMLPEASSKAYIEKLATNIEIGKKNVEGRIQAARSDLEDWKDRAAWSARMAKKGLMGQPQAEADALRGDAAQVALRKLEDEKQVLIDQSANDLILNPAKDERSLLAQAKVGLENCVVKFVNAKMDVESRIEAAKLSLKLSEERAVRLSILANQGAVSKKQVDEAALRRDNAMVALAKVEEEKRVLIVLALKETVTDLKAKLAEAKRIVKLGEVAEVLAENGVPDLFPNGSLVLVLPEVGGLFKNGTLALFCDGSVRLSAPRH